jgi:hypothetical protein
MFIMKSQLIKIILAALLLAGCLPARYFPEPPSPPTVTSTVPISAPVLPAIPTPAGDLPLTPPPTEVDLPDPGQPYPTPVPDYPLTHYQISARFDYDWSFVSVDQTITYTNSSGAPIADLLLVVEANRRFDTFRLKSLSWESGEPVESYQMEFHRLRIPLNQPLEPGQAVILKISYDLNLPEIPSPSAVDRPLPFGYSTRQTNLVDWYPFFPPYLPETGWAVHDPWFFGEHQVYDLGDYEVEIEMTGVRQNVTMAASAPAEIDGRTYRYQMSSARSFAVSASNIYTVFSKKVGEVMVYSYAFTFDEKGGERALVDTAAALELYSRLFGPYPHKTLSVVEADFLDGMEYDGLFFLSRGFYALFDGSPLGYLTAIAVHETAHQWWYGVVGNNQALEPWLDETLCTYTELLYYENLYPDLVDGWWEFRVDYQQPSGLIDGAIYDYNGFVSYRDATYLRGAQFIHELRGLIGDQAFFSFLQDYVSRSSLKPYGLASAGDFFATLLEHTSEDLRPLLEEYFKDSGIMQ